MVDNVHHTPLSGMSYGIDQQVMLNATKPCHKLILRGWWAEQANSDWFRGQFGDTPPGAGEARAVNIDGLTIGRVVWQGPDSVWFFLAEDQPLDDWLPKLQGSIADEFISLVPVSNYYTTIALSGARAVDCLRQGSPFDWRVLPEDNGAVFTVFYKASVLVERSRKDDYRVTVRASYAPYLWQHLCLAVDSLGAFNPAS